jgi:uncharacterized protein HemX
MGLRYEDILKKKSIGTDSPMDPLETGAYTPEIDFSKDTLEEQAPKAKTIGGEEVKTPGSPMDMKAGGMGAAQTIAKGGSATDAAASGLIMTGNPVAMGVGLGLMAHSTIQKKKAEQKQTEYQAKLKQAEARRSAIINLANIGQNLKA